MGDGARREDASDHEAGRAEGHGGMRGTVGRSSHPRRHIPAASSPPSHPRRLAVRAAFGDHTLAPLPHLHYKGC